jgi:hypothetical protein
VNFPAISALESGDTMGERIGRIGRIRTDFFGVQLPEFQAKNQKKSVWIRPIRPIRSPIVSPFSKAEIAVNFRGGRAGFVRMELWAGMVQNSYMRNEIWSQYALPTFKSRTELRAKMSYQCLELEKGLKTFFLKGNRF